MISRILESNQRKGENSLSLNFLIPVCEKRILLNIKDNMERNFYGSKMIVYDPLHPRKNVSITLSSTYDKFDTFLGYVKKELNKAGLFP